MTIPPSTSETTAVRSPLWRRAAVALFRWVYRLTGAALITAALVFIVAQTDWARDYMRTRVLDLLNGQLDGKVQCSDVHLDLFRGIVLERPQLFAHGTTVLEAERISVAYDLAALFGRTLAVNTVEIVRPSINVVRGMDSVWNVSRIVRPSADTTTTPPPDLVIRVRGVSVTGGHVVVDDRTSARGNGEVFDPMHLSLRAFELRAAVRLALRDGDHSIGINHLSFYDEHARTMDVREFTLAARIRPTELDIQSLALRLARTDVRMRAKIDGLDLLKDGINDSILAIHPIVGVVEADSVWGPDIAFVVPDVRLADSYRLRARAAFSGDRLAVEDIDLRAGDGRVHGDVKLTGLSTGDIGVDIHVVDSRARYADVRRRLTFVPLPELWFLNTTTIDSVHLRGHPSDSLWFEVHGSDRPGRVDGRMTLRLNDPELGYEVDMSVKGADLSVFADSSIATELHGRVQLNGRGTDLQTLNGTYRIELDRSIVSGRPVRRALLLVTGKGGGAISIDTLTADLTPFRRDTVDTYALTPDDRLVWAGGTIDAADPGHPRYRGTIGMSALNLAALIQMPSLPTRLTGVVDVDAEGIELDSILGSLRARIDEFSLDDRALMPFTLGLRSSRVNGERTVVVDAPFLQANVRGRFVPSTLIDAIASTVDHTIDAVQQRIRHLYTDAGHVESMGRALVPTEATFDIDLRDASPLNIFLDSMTLSASAVVRGRITSSVDSLRMRLDTVHLRDLLVRMTGLELESEPLMFSGTTALSDISTSPRVAELTVIGRCDTVLRVNGIVIRRPVLDLSTVRDSILARARADVNDIAAGIKLGGRFHEDSTDLQIDSLHVVVDTVRGLEWRMLRPAGLSLRNATVRVNDLAVQRLGSEIGVVNGQFTMDTFTGVSVQVNNFHLTDVQRFVDLGRGHPVTFLDGHVQELQLRVDGPWTAPVVDIAIDAVGVMYNGEPIGSLSAALHHEDKDITGSLTIANPTLRTQTKTLDLRVVHLPIDLGLRGVEQRFVDGRPIDIELRANKLALAAVEPFLPAVERVQGVADGAITIKGTTPDDIDLGGQARFRNASFLSSATNIVYNADGVMHLDGSDLHLDTIVVRNLDRDRKRGIAYANGVVVFDGLSVESMDFTVRSPGILVMNKSSQARSPKVFGDIVIATGTKGTRPIRFHGKLDSPMLEGDIQVLYADIIFPQERSTTKSRYTAFEYNRQTDTARRYNSVLDAVAVEETITDTSTSHGTRHVVADAIESVVKSTTASFVDILRYDLNIFLRGRTLMTMVFGTFEILIADLELDDQKIPLNFTGRFVDNSTNLRGKVRVKDGTSTYKFYKPFVASGTLDFTRGGMTDPALDLKAVYKDRRTLADNRQEDFRVEVVITGTKLKPIAKWSIYRQDRKQEGDSAKITGDALMLILVGKTQDELASSGQSNLVGEVNASLSAVATSALGDLLSGIGGIVQSTQIDIGSDISQSRLTVSGQLWSDVSYRLSGQISDFAGNSTITITVPFTVLSDADAMRYFMLDASRSVNTTGNVTRYQRLWEVKLGARLP